MSKMSPNGESSPGTHLLVLATRWTSPETSVRRSRYPEKWIRPGACDLNLGEAGVRLGGEILYLLKTEYPDTRRIVVTGDPPSGSLRTNILDKYDVADFIIKTRTSVPDLRRVVTEALVGAGSATATPDIEQAQVQVRQRYQDWHERVARIIRGKVREAQDQARNAWPLANRATRSPETLMTGWNCNSDSPVRPRTWRDCSLSREVSRMSRRLASS